MPDLREALLKEHLKSQRLGTPIRASLIPSTFKTIIKLKGSSHRSYRDIFLIILNIFDNHPELFPVNPSRKERKDVFFRLSKKNSLTVLVWAWKRNQRRSNFIGNLTERFLEMIPVPVFLDVLMTRKDQALRLKEDIKDYERAGKRSNA